MTETETHMHMHPLPRFNQKYLTIFTSRLLLFKVFFKSYFTFNCVPLCRFAHMTSCARGGQMNSTLVLWKRSIYSFF